MIRFARNISDVLCFEKLEDVVPNIFVDLAAQRHHERISGDAGLERARRVAEAAGGDAGPLTAAASCAARRPASYGSASSPPYSPLKTALSMFKPRVAMSRI